MIYDVGNYDTIEAEIHVKVNDDGRDYQYVVIVNTLKHTRAEWESHTHHFANYDQARAFCDNQRIRVTRDDQDYIRGRIILP